MTDDQKKPEPKAEAKPAQAKPKTKKQVKISANLQQIIDQIAKLSVIELADLVKALEDKFGVTAAAPVAVAAPAAGEAADKPEEKAEYQVVLTDTGANKIGVIKALREINQDLGLKEAKDLSESTPKEVGTFKKEVAEDAKKKLEAAGAQVDLK